MKPPTLEHLVARIQRLPRLPDTAMRLVHVLSDPSSRLEEIVDTIRYDQVVTAELLRLCNSAYFGLSRHVTSLDDAVVLLGTSQVLQLAMSANVLAVLQPAQEGYGLRRGALWEHSVAVALAARCLAARFDASLRSPAFTLGLLHDIGKLALNEYVVIEYAEIVRRVKEKHLTFVEAEQQVLGFTHPEVGGRLAEVWNLPEALARGIRYHHDPTQMDPPDTLVDCVHLADAACLLMGLGCGVADGLAYRVDPAVLARRELSPHDLETVGAEVVLEFKSVRQAFAERS